MIILGIDPGTATTGFAILKKIKDCKAIDDKRFEVIDFGCITTLTGFTAGERLEQIHNQINSLIKKHKPDLISVESLYFFKNFKTVMPVSQAKGVILLSAAKKKIPVLEFTPLQVKMTIAGYGRAEKKQVQEMTKKLLDLSGFDLKKNNRNKDDAADALGIAMCAGLHNKFLVS
jgi:crossover junction endodeoxyribonuclease RuvC